jgi:hypothetical protein
MAFSDRRVHDDGFVATPAAFEANIEIREITNEHYVAA